MGPSGNLVGDLMTWKPLAVWAQGNIKLFLIISGAMFTDVYAIGIGLILEIPSKNMLTGLSKKTPPTRKHANTQQILLLSKPWSMAPAQLIKHLEIVRDPQQTQMDPFWIQISPECWLRLS